MQNEKAIFPPTPAGYLDIIDVIRLAGVTPDNPDNNVNNASHCYGVAALAPISEKLTAYASWQKTESTKDYQIGLAYQMTDNASVFVHYQNYDIDGEKFDGVGIGVGYKF